MKSRIFTLTGILMSIIFQVTASEPDSSAQNKDSVRPYQITFISPMGTNGLLSSRSSNYMSLNIIAGYNGGVEGIEIGGFANLIENDVNGSQLSGFANMVKGDLKGLQMAGFTNIVAHNVDGIMLAGFSNHVFGDAKSLQMAGFMNQSTASFEGAQMAGFANVLGDSATGLQVAGFGNYVDQNSETTQLAGFGNVSAGDVVGVQAAGFGNVANRVEGAQIAGFINIAKEVKGTQIGFINLSDTFSKGVPIGFYSHVNDGYRRGEIKVNELAWIEGQYRTGVDRFHNIFSLALAPIPGNTGWAFGYGIGTKFNLKWEDDITLDLVGYHINENELWTEALNNLLRFSSTYTFHPKDGNFGITAGPSVNLLINSKTDYYGDDFESTIAPYALIKDDGEYFDTKLWFGAQVGVSF